MQKMFRLQNDNLRPFYSLWLANRWLSFRTDLGGAAVTLIVALSVILSKTITAALAGFVLSYAMTFQCELGFFSFLHLLIMLQRAYSGSRAFLPNYRSTVIALSA